ncbi:MAG: NAD+ synthase [Acidimicrobiales bacterium]
MRLALCQLDFVVGDIDGNTARVLAAMSSAEQAGADLAVFPELAITGYPPEDLLLKPSFVEGNLRALDTVAEASGRCAAVVGFVDADGDLYNSAAVVAGGKVHGVWRKELLPNYGVFDEQRWFRSGSTAVEGDHLYTIGGVQVGVAVCEDAWSPTGPLARLGAGGAQLLVVINGSPFRTGVLAERRRMLATRAADCSAALAYVNLVGGQDELVFDGGSMVFDHDGVLVASAPQFEEAMLLVDLDLRPSYRKRVTDPRGRPTVPPLTARPVTAAQATRSSSPPGQAGTDIGLTGVAGSPTGIALPGQPVTPEPGEAEQIYKALVLATRDYVEKNGFSEVLLALSGGVDSSLVATIAADAIGPERVHGVLLPSRYSSEGSVTDARALAAGLGIETKTVAIEPAHASLSLMLEEAVAGTTGGLAGENLQSRIRMTIVMALSNHFGWLVLTTGNKSEMAVGYATLYGDMAGGFAVIKDVPKTLLYELCGYRNSLGPKPVIPQVVLDKPPSAELRPDQRDDDSLPPYEILDPILHGYVERDLTEAELEAEGFAPDVVHRVVTLVDRAEYKRRQAAPGPRVTSRGFGKDRRMPVTNRFPQP